MYCGRGKLTHKIHTLKMNFTMSSPEGLQWSWALSGLKSGREM